MKDKKFELTYATMYDPPEELHINYEEAVKNLKSNLGQTIGMLINNKDVFADETVEDKSPLNSSVLINFQKGTAKHADQAIAAAKAAAPGWAKTPWQERIKLVRKAADLIDERLYFISAVTTLEVGKNRMEALADIAEAAALMRYSADQMEDNHGFIKEMGKDPLKNHDSTNISILKPHGVWLVISPFNFPFVLTAGPAGAALVAGNTIVIKPASDTPWGVRLLAEAFRDAGFPDGVVNYVTGPGSTLGQALIENPSLDGITFTGSYDVGMGIYRHYANSSYIKPIILELGGKNPVIVSKNADLDRAAQGILRSAFGLQGQKCSAASRVFVESEAHDQLVDRLKKLTDEIKLGDPTRRETFMGPVINNSAYQDFQYLTKDLASSGKIITGGGVESGGDFMDGYYCQPTIAIDVPLDHPLWKQEMFLPIVMITKVESLDSAMQYANDVLYGLTAGFYGNEEETKWFFENIQAGVAYANRPQGATTGAWPGYQPFGGWKGSGSSGKNAGGYHYLQLYMREQINSAIS
jgi:1-pyrroline-5-carboxylate dehydrogenase